MRNRLLYIIFPIISFIPVFLSCEKNTESKDFSPPIISDVRANVEDTILVINGKAKPDTIRYNIDEQAAIDTLIIGKRILFSGRFSDDESLSSYKVVLDSISLGNLDPAEMEDKAYRVVKVLSPIFGEKDMYINNDYISVIPNAVDHKVSASSTVKKLPIREGEYILNVYCTDRNGNEAQRVSRRVELITRKILLESRKQKSM